AAHSERRGARAFAHLESAQMAVRFDRLQCAVYAVPGDFPARIGARRGVFADRGGRSRGELHGLRRAARPTLPRAETLVRFPLLRPRWCDPAITRSVAAGATAQNT